MKEFLRGMSFYAKYVLPRLIDLAMRDKDTTRLRAEWVSRARGEVLEVGIGSGLNLAFYPSEVQRVYGVDPSCHRQFRRDRIERKPCRRTSLGRARLPGFVFS
jgi:hypothetical protein